MLDISLVMLWHHPLCHAWILASNASQTVLRLYRISLMTTNASLTQSMWGNANNHFLVVLNFSFLNLWHKCRTTHLPTMSFLELFRSESLPLHSLECDLLQCWLPLCRAWGWRSHGQKGAVHLQKECPFFIQHSLRLTWVSMASPHLLRARKDIAWKGMLPLGSNGLESPWRG